LSARGQRSTHGSATTGLLDLSAWTERLSGATASGARAGRKDASGATAGREDAGGATVSWKEALAVAQSPEEQQAVRRSVSRGRPLGSDGWLSKLETALNRRLRPLPVGRPRKRKEQQK
jgi:hypothetical protein